MWNFENFVLISNQPPGSLPTRWIIIFKMSPSRTNNDICNSLSSSGVVGRRGEGVRFSIYTGKCDCHQWKVLDLKASLEQALRFVWLNTSRSTTHCPIDVYVGRGIIVLIYLSLIYLLLLYLSLGIYCALIILVSMSTMGKSLYSFFLLFMEILRSYVLTEELLRSHNIIYHWQLLSSEIFHRKKLFYMNCVFFFIVTAGTFSVPLGTTTTSAAHYHGSSWRHPCLSRSVHHIRAQHGQGRGRGMMMSHLVLDLTVCMCVYKASVQGHKGLALPSANSADTIETGVSLCVPCKKLSWCWFWTFSTFFSSLVIYSKNDILTSVATDYCCYVAAIVCVLLALLLCWCYCVCTAGSGSCTLSLAHEKSYRRQWPLKAILDVTIAYSHTENHVYTENKTTRTLKTKPRVYSIIVCLGPIFLQPRHKE